MKDHDLLKAIEADRQTHIKFLQEFVQAASPNPPGDTRLAADVVVNFLQRNGITPEIIAPQSAMPNVVHDFDCTNSQGPRLIMNGHMDVFPVGSSAPDWHRDPWSGDIHNGRLHGRGTVDMKAGTAASIIAYTYLYKFRSHLRGSVGLCAVSDEETGGKFGARHLLEQHGDRWKGDCMINAEPGGIETIRFAEKGTLRLTFTIRTKGAHGAYLHRTKSATRIAAQLICDLAAIEGIVPDLDPGLVEYMKRQDVRDAIDQCMGKGAADIALKPTLNIGVIQGGLKVNMIPAKCVFEADIRLPLGLTRDVVLKEINAILQNYPEATLEVQEAASNPAAGCAHDHSMVQILARRSGEVTGKPALAIPSLGATDCKFWRYHGVPAYVFGVSPESMAAVDESVSVDEFITVIKTHALSAWEYLGGES